MVIYPGCVGCGECVKVCPQDALSLTKPQKGQKGRKAVIDKDKCIGCYECVTVCKQGAISVDATAEFGDFVERMMEYAYGAVQGLEGRVVYLNFLMCGQMKTLIDRTCPGYTHIKDKDFYFILTAADTDLAAMR